METYAMRMAQSKMAVFEESSKKRSAPAEPIANTEASKRQKTDASIATGPPAVMLQKPETFAQLYTLTDNPAILSIDVTVIPIELAKRITVSLLKGIEIPRLQAAVNVGIIHSNYSAVKS
jgi:symplekin